MSSFYRQQLESWLAQIDIEGLHVLDVGGSQKPIIGRAAGKPYACVVLDLPQPHETAEKPGIVADINESWAHVNTGEPYDAVFCLEVMEYVYDPLTAVRNLAMVTKPGGTLYVSFPLAYPPHKPAGTDFLRYTEDGARKLLETAGLEVAEVRPRVHRVPGVLRSAWGADGMRGFGDGSEDHTGYLIIAKKPI